ncbi:MAG: phosphoribosylaminoimidazolesuccinocarboxamide synthase [Desulfohalobiaceae bacterium]|nr:phosphoribosylaminoimidazolesuccinocarboxamide synthase [Desulfohalobiaceae bacterium]
MDIVTQTDIKEYPLLSRGKVRDIYGLDDKTLLIVTTDRMSAFDVVLPDPIPYKGVVLNQLTSFWMNKFESLVKNHLLETDFRDFPRTLAPYQAQLQGRAVVVRKTEPLPIECIVRGYISGSGWKDYLEKGTVCGYELPSGLQESDRLPEPLFTPSTKADIGEHDENITLDQARKSVDPTLLDKTRELSLDIFRQAKAAAEEAGLIIADTKFEFGLADNQLLLIDEVLTPDSSRFWPKSSYQPGQGQSSFDKQFLRDWLNENWDKHSKPPRLPKEIIEQTRDRYLEAFRRLTGTDIQL